MFRYFFSKTWFNENNLPATKKVGKVIESRKISTGESIEKVESSWMISKNVEKVEKSWNGRTIWKKSNNFQKVKNHKTLKNVKKFKILEEFKKCKWSRKILKNSRKITECRKIILFEKVVQFLQRSKTRKCQKKYWNIQSQNLIKKSERNQKIFKFFEKCWNMLQLQ